jgi:hypothetical protein
MAFESLKTRQAEIWGSAPWERVAETLAPLHDHLVAELSPRAGERWLDAATGTGAVAIRAARAGAEVTALDLRRGLSRQPGAWQPKRASTFALTWATARNSPTTMRASTLSPQPSASSLLLTMAQSRARARASLPARREARPRVVATQSRVLGCPRAVSFSTRAGSWRSG